MDDRKNTTAGWLLFAGIVSLGHAAFLGVGAYTEALLAAVPEVPSWS